MNALVNLYIKYLDSNFYLFFCFFLSHLHEPCHAKEHNVIYYLIEKGTEGDIKKQIDQTFFIYYNQ